MHTQEIQGCSVTATRPSTAFWLVLLAAALWLSPGEGRAQGESPEKGASAQDTGEVKDDFEQLYLGELLNTQVTVASMQPLQLQEAPGIITVISADEIARSGARDLMDVLALVPGFDFGMDVNGVVGLGVRGNWAHEGKVLLLIDGLPMQELNFSTLQFGNHYPLQGVERIEIIRGPGSAVYGGNAELGVIHLITRQAGAFDGFSLSGRYGQFDSFQGSDFYHRSAGFSAGKTWDPVSVALHGSLVLGNRSDGRYSDFYGDSYGMSAHNEMNSISLNGAVRWRALQLRLLWDQYHTRQQDLFSTALPEPLPMNFDTVHAELTHESKLGSWTLQPKLRATIQFPWRSSSYKARIYDLDPNDEYQGAYKGLYENRRIEGYHAGLIAHHTGIRNLRWLGGAEVELQRGIALDEFALFRREKESVSFWNTAGFVQLEWQTAPVILTAGARVDVHSEAGWAVVPRISLARAFERFHYKLMFSRALRTPSLANIDCFNPKESGHSAIKPETSTVAELELGAKVLEGLQATANLFFIRIQDPIVYFYDEEDAYDNFSQTGTVGGELELRYQARLGRLRATYAYYQAQDNQVGPYEVPRLGQVKDQAGYEVNAPYLLGFARHKLTVNGHVSVWKGLYLGPSAIWMSKRYGFTSVDENDNLVVEELDSKLLLNLVVGYENLLLQGFQVGMSVHDLLDQGTTYIQPYYNGFHAPLPGPSREFSVFARYEHAL